MEKKRIHFKFALLVAFAFKIHRKKRNAQKERTQTELGFSLNKIAFLALMDFTATSMD